jgi:adenine-specific DNA-methyltransferase
LPETDAKLMAAWDPFDQNAAAPFFDPEWMFGLSSKFDLVIGNPPYVRHEAIKDQKPALQKHYGGKDRQGNPLGAYAGTADLFVYFIQRGIELLNPGGSFAYITSNKWYRAKYGTALRSWMNRHTELLRIVDFGDAEVFDAIAYPTIIIATRRAAPVPAPSEKDSLRVMNWPMDRDKSEVEGFSKLVDEIGFDMPQKALTSNGWQLEPLAKRGLLERIRLAGMPLGQYVEGRFYYGIKTGYNDAFVIDGATKDRLIAEHESSAEIIKPFLRGRDIKRWRVESQDLWLIYVPWHFPLHLDKSVTGASTRAEELFRAGYPAIHAHLYRFKKELSERNQAETGVRYEWYALQRWGADYWEEFEKTKIVYPDIFERPSFAWDDENYYSANTGYFIPTAERWLTGYLNSTLFEWFYAQLSNRIRGGYMRAFSDYMQQVPIPKSATIKQREFIDSIVCVQAAQLDNRLEQLLNGFVYELFFKDDLHARGLTLFDEAERAGLGNLVGLKGARLVKTAEEFASTHLVPGARLRTMLSDLATLDVVRIIEGRE